MMSEINALLAYSVLRETNEIIKKKRSIAKKYIAICQDRGISYIDQENNNNMGNY